MLAFAGFVCLTLYLSLQGDVRFKIASLADEHKGWFDISHENNGFDPDVPLVGIINRVFEERHAPKTKNQNQNVYNIQLCLQLVGIIIQSLRSLRRVCRFRKDPSSHWFLSFLFSVECV